MSVQPTPAAAGDAGRILLVDDEPTNLDILREALAGPDYRLFVARSGEEALRVAPRARPLIVLLDVVMPGIDGYETCRRLKAEPETRDAAVIFVSALTDPKERVKGFEAGAVDFISKPVQPEEVIARVNAHLRIQRLLQHQVEAGAPAAMPAAPDGEAPSAPAIGPPTPGTAVFRTGDIVAFRFRIVRFLALGGMGELYEAEDLELQERVALKTILPHIASDERAISRFKREVHLARQVTHPNVCRIYDVFRHKDTARSTGTPAADVVVLAMELLHGETLAARLRRDGPLAPAELLPLVDQMAAGLTAAHRAGVVHRDFKSDNVMLVKPRADGETRAVVTDFGLAWRSAQNESTALALAMSTEFEICGTPAYMAPEQVEGGPVTPAADVYALGVVLYENVTGAWPFVGDTPIKMATARLHEPPASPRVHVADIDPLWEDTILRCLARRPEDRFASAADVVAALHGGRVEPGAVGTPRPRRWTAAALDAGGPDHRDDARSWLFRVRQVRGQWACGHQVARRPAVEEQQRRSRAGLPVGRHQRSARQPPVAGAGAEGRRQQLVIAFQGAGRGSAGRGAGPECRGHCGRPGLAAGRQPVDQHRADRWARPDAGVGRAIRAEDGRPVAGVGGHLS